MKIKKQCKYIIVSAFASMFFFGVPFLTLAQGYEQKERIPGFGLTPDFIEYLSNLYKFGISIAAILAIFMISFGAFLYIVTSAGNSSKMGNAKDMIFNAIFGLIVVLVAFLILFVVNPDLVRGGIGEVPHAIDFLVPP